MRQIYINNTDNNSFVYGQATIMILVVVVTFALMWLPLYIVFCTIKLTGIRREISDILVPIAQWFGASNSAINPILYSFMHSRFRVWFYYKTSSQRIYHKYIILHRTRSETTFADAAGEMFRKIHPHSFDR